jgi:hypothetical protein
MMGKDEEEISQKRVEEWRLGGEEGEEGWQLGMERRIKERKGGAESKRLKRGNGELGEGERLLAVGEGEKRWDKKEWLEWDSACKKGERKMKSDRKSRDGHDLNRVQSWGAENLNSGAE